MAMSRLAWLLVLALAPAATAASPDARPPAPRLTTLGVTRSATLVSYCWPQGANSQMCADGVAGRPAHILRWRAGAAIRLDLRLPARSVRVDAARIAEAGGPLRGQVHLHPRRLDGTGRRWELRIPRRAGRVTDLLIFARFEHGDFLADLGLRRRA
jgi:hypothetical protein